MSSLREMVIETLTEENGLTDQDLAQKLKNFVASVHPVSLVCAQLEQEGMIKRIKRIGKPSANYLTHDQTPASTVDIAKDFPLPEDALAINSNSEHINELAKIGFVHCGEWYLLRDKPNFSLANLGERSNVLFVLVVDGGVVYMNRSRRSLTHGMNQLLNPQNDPFLSKTLSFINELLKRGKTIEVYGLEDPGLLKFAGYKISLTAGIQASLQDYFRPTWNINRDAA